MLDKITLGNDFSEEEGGNSEAEEAEETKSDDESGDENENSTDDADSENNEDEDSDDEENSSDDDEDDESSEKPDEEKQRELQGLLDTEKALDTDGATLDDKIKAARTRIASKRGDRREKRDLVETIDSTIPPEDEKDDLSDVDPDTLLLLERFTKAKGLVPKSELQNMSYQDAHKASEQAFYEAHPEYKPENDADDVLYLALKEELKNFTKPSDPKKIGDLFEKAHREITRLHPDKFKAPTDKKETKKAPVDDKTKAASVRLKSGGLGGGTGGGKGGSAKTVSQTSKELSDVQITALRDGGWSEEEIKHLTGK